MPIAAASVRRVGQLGRPVTMPASQDVVGRDTDSADSCSRRLFLFGPMRTEIDGRALAIPRGDAQRVMGYLALHPGTGHRREVLAETLWPDAGGRSRRALSDVLYRLRRRLGGGWLDVDSDTVALGPDVWVDVWEFDRLVASGDLRELDAAADMHLNALVPGLYDDWALEHRAARHSAVVTALGRLVEARERSGDLARAVLDARRLILLEPLDESGHQTYLRLLGRLGRYAEAIAHYDSLRQLLTDQLGIAPHATTTDIVNQLGRERDVAAAVPGEDRSRFVGRAAERAEALRAVEAVFDGRGSVVCVEGVAGIGKTRLTAEIQKSARWRGANVLIGRAGEVPEDSALAPLARALGPLMSVPLHVQIESTLDPATLRTLGPFHPNWQVTDTGSPPRESSGRRERAMRVLGAAVASVGPVVVVLDDLHWGGAAFWDGVAAFADGFVPGGGLLVAAYRRPDIEATPGWPVLQSWDRRGLATFLQLRPLELDDVAELLGDHHGVQPADVLALTGGVPFFITQWLQGSAEDRQVDGATMIRRRLDALEPDQRRALDGAAVLGESIPFRVWLEVVDTSPLALTTVSEHLAAGRWITATATGHAFTHDLLRAAAFEQIDPAGRRALHERVAAALSRLDPENTRTRAYHLDQAGLRSPAAAAYRDAGRASRAESSFSGAVEAWGRALELLPRRLRRERMELALDFAEVCDIVGGHTMQRDVLAEAIATARALGDEQALLRALLLSGGTAVRTGETEDGARTLDEAQYLAERMGDRRSVADAVFRRADLLIQTGHWPEGEQQFHDALALVEREVDPWLHGRVLRGLAVSAVRMGRPADAVRWLEEALAGYRAAADPLNEMVTAANLLIAYYEVGAWDQLVATAEQTLPLARKLGDPVNVGIACQGLGLGALAVGDRETARARLAETEACWAAAGRPRLVGAAINSRGLVAEADGDHEEAIELYRAALDAARKVDATTEEAYASHDLGAVLLEVGRSDEAIPLLEAAVQHWADTGNPLLRAKSEASLGLAHLAAGQPPVQVEPLAEAGVTLFHSGVVLGEHPQAWLWSLSQLLRHLGRHAESADVLEAARRELIRQGMSIADTDRRRGFFERVPLNRAIMGEIDATAPPPVIVRLARADAPLGRALRPDEFVEVQWTLHSATDDAISDPVERRRHRLQRLLDEAAQSAATPTDDDLARALGVSRRTILRDMAVLEAGSARSATRRRARQHVSG
jgi:DNA-binding SARP family transcriptional activator